MTNSSSAGETTFLERVEAVNGPASVMYGQVAPGGMIAMDFKKPTATPLRQVSLGFGNWGRYEATFDVSDKINQSGNVKYRISGIGVTQGTQTDYVNYHRVGVLPSISWEIDGKTSLTLLGMYMYTPGEGTANGYPLTGTLISNGYPRIARHTFIGIPSLNNKGEKDAMFEYQFKHNFNKYINFSQTFRYEKSEYNLDNTWTYSPQSGEAFAGPWQMRTKNITTGLDTRIFGNFNIKNVNNTWVVGSDFRDFNMPEYYSYNSQPNNVIDVYNPFSSYRNLSYCFNIHDKSCSIYSSNAKYNWFQEGVYFQDQIKWHRLSVLLGGRQDWVNFHTHQTNYTNETSDGSISTTKSTTKPEPQSAFTWRVGIIYNFDSGLSPYFSYSTSFIPQTNATNYLGQTFAPLTGKQMEAGLKYKVPGKNILITASAFRIDEDHYLINDLVHSGYSTDGGRVRSQGFEVSANANITRDLKMVASYSYTDIRFAKTNQTAHRFDPYTNSGYGNAISESGMSVPYVPRNMFSIFADYTLPKNIAKGFGLNWGMRYVGSTYIDNVESFKTPSYILFDLGAHYDFGYISHALKGLKAQISISNLTNKYYVTSCSTGECYLGQGRRVYGNLTYNW
ncbi:MAG: TonB-dependent siderophore receptor [Acetobacter aceti]|uniref:TonB-dependent siderophore receptor n=1 Tax=Acetobacter aceti TaxID=435 RepID=UPI00098B05F8|nr:TonB-dependent siderophore receptor [Acetobacter aceti]